jgi:hypothetical protein
MLRTRLCVLAGAVVVAAGCGGEVTDVSEGVDRLNQQVLQPQGARLECPDEVDGGEGTTFECTMRSTNGDASAPVTMKIVEERGELAIDTADQQQFERARERVTRG